jgi:hypothetical protein
MLIGEPPFTGPTTQSVVAKVLTESPRSLRTGRPTVPAHIDAAVQKGLSKLPADRFRTALEFADALSRPGHVAPPASSAVAPEAGRTRWTRPQMLAVGALVLASLAFGISGWLRTPPASPEPVVRSVLRLPDEALAAVESRLSGSPLAISPDGSVLVYSGKRQLFMRRLDQTEVTPIPNTLGAEQPFFSPDGRHIAFVADGSLKRMPVAGGPVVTICPVQQIQRGAKVTWSFTHPGSASVDRCSASRHPAARRNSCSPTRSAARCSDGRSFSREGIACSCRWVPRSRIRRAWWTSRPGTSSSFLVRRRARGTSTPGGS